MRGMAEGEDTTPQVLSPMAEAQVSIVEAMGQAEAQAARHAQETKKQNDEMAAQHEHRMNGSREQEAGLHQSRLHDAYQQAQQQKTRTTIAEARDHVGLRVTKGGSGLELPMDEARLIQKATAVEEDIGSTLPRLHESIHVP